MLTKFLIRGFIDIATPTPRTKLKPEIELTTQKNRPMSISIVGYPIPQPQSSRRSDKQRMAWKHTLVFNPGRTYLPRGQAEPLDIGPELRLLAAGAGELQARGLLASCPGHRHGVVLAGLGGRAGPWGREEQQEEDDDDGGRPRQRHVWMRAGGAS